VNLKDVNLSARWENGVPHHPLAERLARLIGEIDFACAGDSFCFKFGGDGDNGETLTYILSEIFERNLLNLALDPQEEPFLSDAQQVVAPQEEPLSS
jgi:hypothetical protein